MSVNPVPVEPAKTEKEQAAALEALASFVLNDAAALFSGGAIMEEFREWQEAKKSRLKNRLMTIKTRKLQGKKKLLGNYNQKIINRSK